MAIHSENHPRGHSAGSWPATSRPRSRRHLGLGVVLAVVLLLPVLAGCSRGFGQQTDQIYQPGPGISVRSGGVYGINMLVMTDGAGHGTLVGALINQQRRVDVLESVSITSPSSGALKTTILPGTIPLPSQRAVQLAHSGDVRVEGNLVPGDNYKVTLLFHNAAPITTLIPAIAQSLVYENVPVGPVPSGTTPTHTP